MASASARQAGQADMEGGKDTQDEEQPEAALRKSYSFKIGMEIFSTHGTESCAVNIDAEPADGGFEVPDEGHEAGHVCNYLWLFVHQQRAFNSVVNV